LVFKGGEPRVFAHVSLLAANNPSGERLAAAAHWQQIGIPVTKIAVL
jgi:hypothetical protein